jgi:uncharacterized protein
MNTKLLSIALVAAALLGAGWAYGQLSSPVPGVKPAGAKPANPANSKPDAAKAAAATSSAAKPASASSAAQSTDPNASALAQYGVPAGQGAGTHGANSPFAAIVDRPGVVPWSVLTSIKTKVDNKKIVPIFTMDQMALNQKSQKVQGFMMPLEPGEKQRHFLLTSVPMTCGFCLPGGPESMIEVRTKTPIKYTLDPVVVEGKFVVLNDDPYGLYYRITEAATVQ